MDKSWDTFEFLGRFPIHTYPAPPLTPQTTLDACCGIFSPVSTLYRVGETTRMHCFMIACVKTTSSPLRFLLRGGRGGGESVYRLFYQGAQKLEEVMNTIMNTEIMNTFPKTFVQDCSYFYHHYFPFSHVCFFIFL